jgi:DNA polymerase V
MKLQKLITGKLLNKSDHNKNRKEPGMGQKDQRTYIAIDLKSFYASVACRDLGLDPLTTNLVVADPTRTEKTICLAVSPSLKAYGIPGRARLFEVNQAVDRINAGHPDKLLTFRIAPPHMARYMEVSRQIYGIYLRFVAPEDIQVYSVDEVFMDVTGYLHSFHGSPHEMAMTMIHEVLKETGITATAGIGPNLYLAKIAMDVMAKHIPPDQDGVRISELTVRSYREKLWDHRPLTDFWRLGPGIARRLEKNGMHTMGEVALMALQNEDWFYQEFGVNAEFLIDHAFGYEPCTIKDIKDCHPMVKSVSQGQVLASPYIYDKARLVVREMAETLALDLVRKHFLAGGIVLTVGYDIENLTDPLRRKNYHGPIVTDRYGRRIPKSAHGTERLETLTSSNREIVEATVRLFDRIVDPSLLVRRMYVVADRIRPEGGSTAELEEAEAPEDSRTIEGQLSFFDLLEEEQEKKAKKKEIEQKKARERSRDHKAQEAILKLQKKYGKNVVMKGMDLEEGATQRDRNGSIGGHKA